MIKKLTKLTAGLITLFVVMSASMFAFKVCPPKGPWPTPPWCSTDLNLNQASGINQANNLYELFERQLLLTNINQMEIPMISNERLRGIYANALGWQGLSVENVGYRLGSSQLIQTANNLGMPVISSMNIMFLIRANSMDELHTAALDIEGHPIKLGDKVQFMHGSYRRNLLSPEYQTLLWEDIKANIDVGVHGIVFDDSGDGMASSLIFEYGGSFDELSMQGFRDFLENKYTDAQLMQLFKIDSIQDFNFKDYIIRNELQDTWNQNVQQPHPLTYEFLRFQSTSAREIIRDLTIKAKTYAKEAYQRDFLISFNLSPIFPEKFISAAYDLVDMPYGEHFWFHNHHFKGAVAVKLFEGISHRPPILLFEVSHDRGQLKQPIGNSLKYAFADVYSSGQASLQVSYPGAWTLRGWDYVEPIRYDESVFSEFVAYFHENQHLFNLKEEAQVAVVHSLISRTLDFKPIERSLHQGGAPDRQLISVVDMLLNLNMPFHMIVSGDGVVSVDAFINQSILSQYELVILPNIMVLSVDEVEELIAYVEQGGKVIQINAFANLTVEGETVQVHPKLQATQTPGQHRLGEGVWITENWGNFEYSILYSMDDVHQLPTEQDADSRYLLKLEQLITEQVEMDMQVYAPHTINVRKFIDDTRTILHIVNYDYHPVSDQFTSGTDIMIRLKVKDTSNLKAQIYDVERQTIEDVAIEIEDAYIVIKVPRVEVYSIVEITAANP